MQFVITENNRFYNCPKILREMDVLGGFFRSVTPEVAGSTRCLNSPFEIESQVNLIPRVINLQTVEKFSKAFFESHFSNSFVALALAIDLPSHPL